MRLKELDISVKEHEIKYDGREKLISDKIERCVNECCDKPEKLEELLIDYFSLYKDEKERLAVLLFDTKLKLIGINVVAVGTIDGVQVHPREVFRVAIAAGAKSIVIAHNHPSGEVEPSSEDINLVRRIRDAGGVVGISLNDSFIVSVKKGKEKCRSMRRNNDVSIF